MYTTVIFVFIIILGFYFIYIRPKQDTLNKFKNDPQFSHYMLIVESNSEFNKNSYDKFLKHLKLFLIYFSEAFEKENMLEKMKKQHNNIMKYLNRMLLSIPNSMKRHMYMQNSIDNIDNILKNYLKVIEDKYNNI